MPLRPKKSRAPTYDNLRVIIREKLSKYYAYIVEVDGLKHIARHFSQNRKGRSARSVGSSIRLSRLRERDRAMKKRFKKNSPKRKKLKIKKFRSDAYDLLAHYDNRDKNVIKLHDIVVNGISRTKYNYGIRYVRGRYRDITKEFTSRRGYQPRYGLPNSSRLGPDPRDFEFKFEFTNLNWSVGNSIIDNHFNYELQELAIYMINYNPTDLDNTKYHELEDRYGIIRLTLDDKWSFYINHAGKITFSEFKQHSLWLDLLLLTIKLSHPPLVDYQLRYLWKYYSSWLLLSAGYRYSGISRFNIREIIQQLDRIAGGYDKTPQHVDRHRGYMVEIRDHNYFYFDDEFKGFVYKMRFNRYLKIKYDVYLRSKLDEYERIRVKITRYGEDEYLWILRDKWEVYARIRYNPHSYIKLSATLLEDTAEKDDGDEEDEDEIEEKSFVIIEEKPTEYDVTIRLKMIENEIWMEFNEEKGKLDIEREYSDLSELLQDLNTREINLEYEDRMVTIRWGRYDVIWGELGIVKAIFFKDKNCRIGIPDDIETMAEYMGMEGEKISCTLKHNDDKCVLTGDPNNELGWSHFDCWDLECDDLDIKNALGLNHQRGFYGYDMNFLYTTGFIIIDDYRYDLDISLSDEDIIYQEDLGTLWVLRGKKNDLSINQVPVLTHTKPDTYRLNSVDEDEGTLIFKLISNRDKGEHKIKKKPRSKSQCKRFEDFHSILSNLDKTFEGYKVDEDGVEDLISPILAECKAHFVNCGCNNLEDREYDYGGTSFDEDDDGVTITMQLPYPDSVFGEQPEISISWEDLHSDVRDWLVDMIDKAKTAESIDEMNDKNVSSLFSLVGFDQDRVYSDTVDPLELELMIREFIGSLEERDFDVSDLIELMNQYDNLVEELI